ncbi:dihydropteroate synthase [Aureispira anguillae]|uniref:dihydropteroate synthase n=2 Tax=Aureispira anguillae TaxID=2864201 RepID=A0A916DUJ2_9BACT|nr:dihydropteroate synthase [Aureispira anguillae]
MLINCRGKLLDLSKPVVMGILNMTPDSFYEGSRIKTPKKLLQQVEMMLEEGATILDIGGASSRPGAALISVEEERKRVIPAIELIRQYFPNVFISIDTYRATITKEAIQAGVHLVNDISASSIDKDLLEVVAQHKVPYVLMHMQGKPQNMQDQPVYADELTEVLDFFIQKIALLKEKGIQDIILDVGFGFGKTLEHNYRLLNNLNIYQILNLPMLVGISRKSMIWKLLGNSPQEALNGTTALHMIALQQGAHILRVHDVKAAQEAIQLHSMLLNNL